MGVVVVALAVAIPIVVDFRLSPSISPITAGLKPTIFTNPSLCGLSVSLTTDSVNAVFFCELVG